eukprot:scaffold1501_cov331-Prasinococcus_capsulatus_cf.AAC.2
MLCIVHTLTHLLLSILPHCRSREPAPRPTHVPTRSLMLKGSNGRSTLAKQLRAPPATNTLNHGVNPCPCHPSCAQLDSYLETLEQSIEYC